MRRPKFQARVTKKIGTKYRLIIVATKAAKYINERRVALFCLLIDLAHIEWQILC